MRPWKRTSYVTILCRFLKSFREFERDFEKKKITEKHYVFYEWPFLLSDWKLANHRALLLPSNISYKNAKVGYDEHFAESASLLVSLLVG